MLRSMGLYLDKSLFSCHSLRLIRWTSYGSGKAGNPRSVVTSGRLVSGVLSVVSRTELRYRAIYSTDGKLLDELTITQPRY